MTVVYVLLAVGIATLVYAVFKKDNGEEIDHKMENFSITLMKELERTNKRVDALQEELEQVKTREVILTEQLKYEQKQNSKNEEKVTQ
ncbi:hypothetical protein [Salisediminibacterium selenitireducens]|uniref:Uncharacterized protein n=1 Tax=Bacillus selenitireducens (strain ATCC 700615 / DSM 15326 / MLS10) TaxID=439292 RepID=D6XWT7_BACIE|nr:hypothetical protein [Salisediminibacterium selenitireducens]ADH99913.1 hypothetical protein Bsel_2411 [[Bacillus] selenitireducens MLS10]